MRYTIHQSKVNNGTKGKFYLRPVYDETVGLDELAEHMASHNSPFSKGQLLAILTDIVGCIKELCLESKSVRIDGLGIFEAGCLLPRRGRVSQQSPRSQHQAQSGQDCGGEADG